MKYKLYILLFVLFLAFFFILAKPGLFLRHDAATSFSINSFLLSMVSTWSNHVFLGYDSTLSSIPRLSFYLLNDIIFYITDSPYLTQLILFMIIFLYGFNNFYRFLKYNLKDKEISLILAGFATINFFTIDRIVHTLILIGYFTLPLSILYLQKSLNKKFKIKNFLLFSLSTVLLLISPHQTYVFMIIAAIIILESNILKNFIKVFLLIVLSLVINSYYILPLLSSYKETNQLGYVSSQLSNAIFHLSSDTFLYNTLRFTGYYYSMLNSMDIICFITFFLPLLIITSLFIKGNYLWKIMLILGMFLSSILYISKDSIVFLKKFLPLFSGITDTTYFVPLIIIPSLILIGMLIKEKKVLKKYFIFVLILLIFANLFLFNKIYIKDEINKEYLNSSGYLNDNKISRTLILPLGWVQSFPESSYIYSGINMNLLYPNEIVGQRASELMLKKSSDIAYNLEMSFYNQTLDIESLNKLNIDKILVYKKNIDLKEKDLYLDIEEEYRLINKNLENNKERLINIYSDDYIDVYKINYSNGNLPRIYSKGLYFSSNGKTKYKLFIHNLNESQDIIFLDSYHDEWKLYIEKNPGKKWCKEIIDYSGVNTAECNKNKEFIKEISYLLRNPVFDDKHSVIFDYANSWKIDPKYIISNYPEDYYLKNESGIDIELVLIYRSQLYFYIGFIISLLSVLISIVLIITDYMKQK
ncbi:MAG: hypothetical protein Q8N99_03105 [Nanoarchaeota archaeon]|nr:hypothetical protein [Nanoarchaeota archaeon]